jgi:hypothetical protein
MSSLATLVSPMPFRVNTVQPPDPRCALACSASPMMGFHPKAPGAILCNLDGMRREQLRLLAKYDISFGALENGPLERVPRIGIGGLKGPQAFLNPPSGFDSNFAKEGADVTIQVHLRRKVGNGPLPAAGMCRPGAIGPPGPAGLLPGLDVKSNIMHECRSARCRLDQIVKGDRGSGCHWRWIHVGTNPVLPIFVHISRGYALRAMPAANSSPLVTMATGATLRLLLFALAFMGEG